MLAGHDCVRTNRTRPETNSSVTPTAPAGLPPWMPTVEEEAALDARYWDERYAEPDDDYEPDD